MRRWTAALALAVAGFAVAAPGGTAGTIVPAAQRYAAHGPAMREAQRIARAYWGANPCGGRVTIAWAPRDPAVNARSTWRSPYAGYRHPEDNTRCRVTLNAAVSFDWPKLCTVVVHEYGHLTGHPHRHDGVMAAVYRRPVAAC